MWWLLSHASRPRGSQALWCSMRPQGALGPWQNHVIKAACSDFICVTVGRCVHLWGSRTGWTGGHGGGTATATLAKGPTRAPGGPRGPWALGGGTATATLA